MKEEEEQEEQESNSESEWNEQMPFSKAYFKASDRCRIAQIGGDWSLLNRCVLAKLNTACGVLPIEKQRKLFDRIAEIDNVINDLEAYKLNSNTWNGKKGNTSIEDIIIRKLFFFETEIDTEVNKHMPFLNMKKRIDLGGI